MNSLLKYMRKVYKALQGDPIQVLLDRGLVVGEHFAMMEDVVIDHSHCWHIEIGDYVTLAPRVHILAHDASTKKHLGYTRIAKVKIGSRVFIGASAIILPGVTIGNDVVIGAGSVVSRDIPDNSIVAGSPARVVGSHQDFLIKKRNEFDLVPVFDSSYTIHEGVTEEKRNEMNATMSLGIGYIK